MLLPKRVKHRKQFRGSMAGKATRGNKVTHGEFGLMATEPCWIRSNQIEAARVAMTRYIKRGGDVFIKIFPDKPVTGKPIGVRMGKGKGNVEYWVAVVKTGRVMFEIGGVSEEAAREALRLAMHKLPCKCKIVAREADASAETVSDTSAKAVKEEVVSETVVADDTDTTVQDDTAEVIADTAESEEGGDSSVEE